MSNNTDDEMFTVNVAVIQPCKEAIAIIGKTQQKLPKYLKNEKTKPVKKTTRKTTKSTQNKSKVTKGKESLEKGE